MAKQSKQQKPDVESAGVEEEIKDRVQSENVEPEKVENPPPVGPPEPPEGMMAGVIRDAEKVNDVVKLETFNPTTHVSVNRKLFNKMVTTLALGKGLQFYTGNGFVTQLGELMGLKKDEPGFYEKARTLMHEIMVEHQKG